MRAENGQMKFDCVRVNGSISRFPVTLNLPGMHNVLNALAAIAVATEVQVPDAAIQKALAEFRASAAASSVTAKWPAQQAARSTLVDDYGHHPAEMAATLAAARGLPGRRLVLAFQPTATAARATASRIS